MVRIPINLPAPKGKRMVPVNLEAEQADALRELSLKTRISQQSFLREAVTLILEKYRKEFAQ